MNINEHILRMPTIWPLLLWSSRRLHAMHWNCFLSLCFFSLHILYTPQVWIYIAYYCRIFTVYTAQLSLAVLTVTGLVSGKWCISTPQNWYPSFAFTSGAGNFTVAQCWGWIYISPMRISSPAKRQRNLFVARVNRKRWLLCRLWQQVIVFSHDFCRNLSVLLGHCSQCSRWRHNWTHILAMPWNMLRNCFI